MQDIVAGFSRQYINVEFNWGQCEGTRSLDTKRFCVVSVRNKNADDYHLYITNLPRQEVSSGGSRDNISVSMGNINAVS
jgi:putative transposase